MAKLNTAGRRRPPAIAEQTKRAYPVEDGSRPQRQSSCKPSGQRRPDIESGSAQNRQKGGRGPQKGLSALASIFSLSVMAVSTLGTAARIGAPTPGRCLAAPGLI